MTDTKTQKSKSVKQLESEIESLKQALELKDAQLKEKTEQLELAQQHLVSQKRLADIGTFTTGILHEIVNKIYHAKTFVGLNQIKVIEFLETLQKESELDTEEATDLLTNILKFSEYTSKHLKEAMSLTRVMELQAYEGSSSPNLIDLNQLIKSEFQIIECSRTLIKGGSIRVIFELDFDSNISEISIVAEDFVKILTNLLNNAFDSLLAKRRKLGEEDYEPKIIIKTTEIEEAIAVEIWDNGKGIPENLLPKIFEPFMTTKPSSEGTGIGLSVVRDLAEKNHWKVEVDSQEGQYARFRLILF
jgi:signal transduction histidine kinase